ncbi:MAG: Histone acetyltransferase [Myxococcales bacterium]|nr:Histone acetyltransferase [Myxococcales bacterium]
MDPRLSIRPIRPEDEPAVAQIIRTVMPEFGASGPGFAIHDPEVDHMCAAYRGPRAAYWVVADGERLVGGGGIAPLENGDAETCELRKMYFLAEARGRGVGAALLERCLVAARELGFRTCYLETLVRMDAARKLYARFGFEKLCAPMGNTGHFGCDSYFALDLTKPPATAT